MFDGLSGTTFVNLSATSVAMSIISSKSQPAARRRNSKVELPVNKRISTLKRVQAVSRP